MKARCRLRVVQKSRNEETKHSLSTHHYNHLIESGISAEVIKERGYFTAWNRAELRALGFGPKQAQAVSCLVIPIWGVEGKVVAYQIRPDFPRYDSDKPRKYELPYGSKNRIDVPRRAFADLNDNMTPLWITEGIKKADAAVSHGLCCVALYGVNNWVTKRDGDTESSPLDDWNKFVLTHRRVYICFDSDVMTNPKVAQALRRLKNFLRGKNATVIPIYLPEKDGEKVGLDDYFANGGTVEELQALTKRHSTNQGPGGIRPELPTMYIHNNQLAQTVDEAIVAIVDANTPPEVFNYSGRLTRVRIEETNRSNVARLETMTKDVMIDHLSRVAGRARNSVESW